MAAANHGAGHNHQHPVKHVAQRLRLESHDKIQNQQHHRQSQRQGAEIPYQRQLRPVASASAVPDQHRRRQEEQQREQRQQHPRRSRGFRDKSQPGAHNKQQSPRSK